MSKPRSHTPLGDFCLRKSGKLSVAFKIALSVFFATGSGLAQSVSWPGGNVTHSTSGPYDDGSGGSYTIYTNWVYTDSNGLQHAFQGETETDHINLGYGKYRTFNTTLSALSTDGQFVLNASGPTGAIGVEAYIHPLYHVLSVIYAPPGAASYVDYSNGSTLGSSTSVSRSFSNSTGLTVSFGASAGVAGASNSISANWTKTQENTSELAIEKSSSFDLKEPGPANSGSGIDHDFDIIYLWLNPQVNLRAMDPNTATWDMVNDPNDPASNGGALMDILPVYVYWLKNPSTMPSNVVSRLQRSWPGSGGALGSNDFATILARDPFANGTTTVDTSRFQLLSDQTFAYLPPPPGGQPITQSYTLTKKNTYTNTNTSTDQFSISASASVGVNFILNGSITATNAWTWTKTTTLSNSMATDQSASLSITGPDAGYTGNTNVLVYWDSIYNTFMFKFAQ